MKRNETPVCLCDPDSTVIQCPIHGSAGEQAMSAERWDGIAELAEALCHLPRLAIGREKALARLEAELRRRVEPLLLAAEKLSSHWTIENNNAVKEELATWKK